MLYLFYAVVCLAGDWVGGWGVEGGTGNLRYKFSAAVYADKGVLIHVYSLQWEFRRINNTICALYIQFMISFNVVTKRITGAAW